ncbi:Uncharacterised protein [Niallia circulans]|nr:Uncharacterised protein [Niallia circulans]
MQTVKRTMKAEGAGAVQKNKSLLVPETFSQNFQTRGVE